MAHGGLGELGAVAVAERGVAPIGRVGDTQAVEASRVRQAVRTVVLDFMRVPWLIVMKGTALRLQPQGGAIGCNL